ncbi:hypothetical protein ACQW02_27740 [Humitalea sp. 24SJ18S-53]|uniref:hypothetical protein n=1 Tax=Humitalea sp. 24SJ18S-53 TaxID=3422307 RepID=UPI003D6644AB
MPTVTLVLVSGAHYPEGSPEHRYELDLILDRDARPDAAAWAADEAPWRARRFRPGDPMQQGDIQYDEDDGWTLRFFGAEQDGPDDTPLAASLFHEGPWRPGEIVTLRGRGGRESAWRIVAVG